MSRRSLHRLLAVAGAVAVTVAALAAPASAHVTVTPDAAAKGGFAAVTFRVPTERDDASTSRVEIALPTDHPLAFVSLRPVPGWTAATTEVTLPKPVEVEGAQVTRAVGRVVWTADTPGAQIRPGQFQEFALSVGPLPTDADQVVFKALQTYDDGKVVRWIEEPAAGAAEPENPAPVLTLTAATGAADGATPKATAEAAGDTDDDGPGAVAVAGLVAGLAGLVLGGLALARTFRRA